MQQQHYHQRKVPSWKHECLWKGLKGTGRVTLAPSQLSASRGFTLERRCTQQRMSNVSGTHPLSTAAGESTCQGKWHLYRGHSLSPFLERDSQGAGSDKEDLPLLPHKRDGTRGCRHGQERMIITGTSYH